MPTVNNYIKDSITSIKIDKDGVEKLLSKIKPHKACGPDQIPNMVLKVVYDFFIKSFEHFNFKF